MRDGLPRRLVRPLEEFLGTETLGGLLLLGAAAGALIWANTAETSYLDTWHREVGRALGPLELRLSLVEWINDAAMALFFFVVGLEIKRELLRGELADRRAAALPVAGALGGMAAPAAIYLAMNAGGGEPRGWGIPMATDIAFAVGALALLGSTVPVALKVFLLALAIVDDIGAIVVIAVFYTDDLSLRWLALAVTLLAATAIATRGGARHGAVFACAGVALWLALHQSGIHATIAGVALAMLVPATHERDAPALLDRMEHVLHPWASYAIVPAFALANAGVVIDGAILREAATSRVTLGVALGLLVGKPLGIVAFSWLAVRYRLAALPNSVGWTHLGGVAVIAGIGFTVSIFVSNLAFDDGAFVAQAKLGVLAASLAAAAVGLLLLRTLVRQRAVEADAA